MNPTSEDSVDRETRTRRERLHPGRHSQNAAWKNSGGPYASRMPDCRAAFAGQLLSTVLGGNVVPRDVPGAPAGTHDFDLKLDDDRTIAVEVTFSADHDKVEFWHVVHKTEWDVPQLEHSWLLNVTPLARVGTLRGKIESLLRALERRSVYKFGLGVKVSAPEIDELYRLLVKAGAVWPDVHPSRIGIYSTGGGATSTELVREVVEYEASKPDNRNKLARAKVDERHLFVGLDPATSPTAPASGFMDVRLPGPCNLPPEVDVAWIAIPATDDAGNPTEHLWRLDRENGWQKSTQ